MWDCSVCTYNNPPEAFKCLMCDVRKGTSTRKPRLNAELAAAQVAQVSNPKPKKSKDTKKNAEDCKVKLSKKQRLTNIDRTTAEHNAVTVNNVTVIITEFKPKQRKITGEMCNTGLSTSDADSVSDNSNDNRNETAVK